MRCTMTIDSHLSSWHPVCPHARCRTLMQAETTQEQKADPTKIGKQVNRLVPAWAIGSNLLKSAMTNKSACWQTVQAQALLGLVHDPPALHSLRCRSCLTQLSSQVGLLSAGDDHGDWSDFPCDLCCPCSGDPARCGWS